VGGAGQTGPSISGSGNQISEVVYSEAAIPGNAGYCRVYFLSD
jgi:hypothetical protein